MVYKGFDSVEGRYVAVKVTQLAVDHDNEQRLVDDLKNEFSIVAQLDHPNIVKMLHFDVVDKAGQIIMELMPGGSISDLMRQTRFRLHEQVIRRYMREALLGISFLHKKNIVHRDIKPANMLLSGTGELKLSDFGTSKHTIQSISMMTQHTVGTPCYLSKEAIMAGKYSPGSDLWALGCSVVEMATCQLPWAHLDAERQSPIQLIFAIGTAQPPNHHPIIPVHLSAPLRDILEKCFKEEDSLRPSAEALLELDYFHADGLPSDAESFDEFNRERESTPEAQIFAPETKDLVSEWSPSSDFLTQNIVSADTTKTATLLSLPASTFSKEETVRPPETTQTTILQQGTNNAHFPRRRPSTFSRK